MQERGTGGAAGAPRFTLREASASDLPEVLALNNAAAPNVNALDAETLARIVALASWFRVAVDAEGVAGFVLCIPHGHAYWSDNYRWFSERYGAFLYLDRVVVAERVRGQGIGGMLYAEMHDATRGRWPRVALEVNLDPPNPGSVRFHERIGYTRVGERRYDNGAVIMYVREP